LGQKRKKQGKEFRQRDDRPLKTNAHQKTNNPPYKESGGMIGSGVLKRRVWGTKDGYRSYESRVNQSSNTRPLKGKRG